MTLTEEMQEELRGKASHLLVVGGTFSRLKTNGISKTKKDSLLSHVIIKNNKKNFHHQMPSLVENQEYKRSINVRVRLVLYDKPVNPYLIIFDSSDSFAMPVAHLKLRMYDVAPVDKKQFTLVRRVRTQDSGTNVDLNSITFQAHSMFARNNWVDTLRPLSHDACECNLAPSRPKKRLNIKVCTLPTLSEENESNVD